LEDVSEEHARKTITVEGHPNLSLSAASIHPCRHGETMKRLVDNIVENGGAFQIEQ
jgi:ubiquitin-like-conjugating enzyme ATG3